MPGREQIAGVDAQGRREFAVPGRRVVGGTVATASGKAEARPTPVPATTLRDGEIRLMSLRSEDSSTTVVYEEHDYYRGNERRDVIMLNEDDARARGLRRDQRARVANPDRAHGRLVVHFEAAAARQRGGVLPGGERPDPAHRRPRVRTPVFKSTTATITPL
ncbi:MAG: molybdopterin dinucleotide binding domain-containing protein [Steroidobacteraceae bacterium]